MMNPKNKPRQLSGAVFVPRATEALFLANKARSGFGATLERVTRDHASTGVLRGQGTPDGANAPLGFLLRGWGFLTRPTGKLGHPQADDRA